VLAVLLLLLLVISMTCLLHRNYHLNHHLIQVLTESWLECIDWISSNNSNSNNQRYRRNINNKKVFDILLPKGMVVSRRLHEYQVISAIHRPAAATTIVTSPGVASITTAAATATTRKYVLNHGV
jgi:hypothetical protein